MTSIASGNCSPNALRRRLRRNSSTASGTRVTDPTPAGEASSPGSPRARTGPTNATRAAAIRRRRAGVTVTPDCRTRRLKARRAAVSPSASSPRSRRSCTRTFSRSASLPAISEAPVDPVAVVRACCGTGGRQASATSTAASAARRRRVERIELEGHGSERLRGIEIGARDVDAVRDQLLQEARRTPVGD